MHVTLVSPFETRPRTEATRDAHVGGVERVFDEISRNVAARGHDVTLVCSTTDEPGETHEGGVRVVRVARRGTFMRAPVAALAGAVPRDSDLVHVAATYPFTTPRVLRRARALGMPSVLDFHFEPDPGTRFGRLAAAAYRQIGPRAYPLAARVLVRSLAYARGSASLASVSESRLRVLPNGVDPGRFHPRGREGPGDYLLFVGRLVPYKGLDVLFEALSRQRIGLPLFIAGDGPLREVLEMRARDLGVDVRFLGRVEDRALPDLYRGARLTVLPSVTRQEAFGLALVESMACGTPVVASALPGVAELATRGGLVARPGDANDLGHVLARAAVRGALLRGAALASATHDTFAWDAVTDRLLAIYGEVLGHDASEIEVPRLPEVGPAAHPVHHSVL
ncbi:MAG: glycosyltransferase family 4 protein [Thermoplasmatota archaeon]